MELAPEGRKRFFLFFFFVEQAEREERKEETKQNLESREFPGGYIELY